MKDMYADDVARNIGDVLTIKIVEDSDLDSKATRTLSKTTSRDQHFNGDIAFWAIV